MLKSLFVLSVCETVLFFETGSRRERAQQGPMEASRRERTRLKRGEDFTRLFIKKKKKRKKSILQLVMFM